MKKAIFGGTFNPIHLGHCEIIANVAALNDVEQVIVMPAKTPPHKVCTDLACDADRLEMCKLATKNIDKTIVSDIELFNPVRIGILRKNPIVDIDGITALQIADRRNVRDNGFVTLFVLGRIRISCKSLYGCKGKRLVLR